MVKELLKRLSNGFGVSGFEGDLRDIIRDELKGSVDEFIDDPMGNLIAVRRGGPFKVMIAAHMDEIGIMVQYIDEKGFIRFVPIGGWYGPTLYEQRVIFHGRNGPVRGVIGAKPPHMMDAEERKKEIKIEEMFADVGAKSAEEAAALGIEIGTPGVVEREFADLHGSLVTGKALDNRVGVAMLIRTLQQLDSPHTVYAVFTVQEEVGLKGAKVAAYRLDPDCAIATDVTIPGDHPGIEKKDSTAEIGKGPIIELVSAAGRGLMSDQKMVQWLRDAGDAHQVPYQLLVGTGGNTDATIIHLVRGGIPSVPLTVATRYIHSPVEVVDCADIESAVRLLVQALKTRPEF